MVQHWFNRVANTIGVRNKGALFFAISALIVSFATSAALQPQTANASPTTTLSATTSLSQFTQFAQPTGLGGGAGLASGFGSGVSTCAIETVGWVICPVMRSIAKLADYGFAFININFLKIDVSYTNTSSGLFTAWRLMLTVANAVFVVAFIVIIYSQITGRNAGGYNIKRILPRLIIGAIFVNVSYYICIGIVDVTNVLGTAILDALKGVSDRIGPAAMSLDNAADGFEDGILTDITSSVLTKNGTVWILLAPLSAVTVTIATVSAAGLVLLIMRKVLVAMLILVSPIMFVAYLLPNLEKYFQQWLRLFIQLLLLFPIIAFLLGAGQIVSATIMNVGSSGDTNYRVQDDSYQSKSGGSGSATTDLAAAGAAVLPLLGVWFIFKGLSSVVSNARSRIGGRGNKSKSKDESKQSASKQAPVAQSKLMGQSFDRKPAFSRLSRRRKATSSLPLPSQSGDDTKKQPGAAANRSGLRPLGGMPGAPGDTNTPKDPTEALNQMGQPPNSNIPTPEQAAAQALGDAQKKDGGNIDANGGTIEAQVAAQDDKIKKDEKPWEKLRGQKQVTPSATGGAPGGPVQSAPTGGGQATNFQAPAVAQAGNSQASNAPQSGGQQPIYVAVPVTGASLLGGQNNPQASNSYNALPPPSPSTGVQQKAKARAQKYIFDAATSLEQAQAKIDLLTDQKIKDEKIGDTPEEKTGEEDK